MVWRFYDIMNGQWFSDVLYPTQEACREAARSYMREAHARGEMLELVADPLDPSEPLESVLEDMPEPSCNVNQVATGAPSGMERR